MKFKPMLAPNEQPNLNDIQYPILASYKLDGLRCIFLKGEMVSRSLKPIQNKQLREKFKPLTDYSRERNLILDGEIYSHELTFQDIVSFVMTQDFEDKKSIKKYGKVRKIPESLKFYIFDCITDDKLEQPFNIRTLNANSLIYDRQDILETVWQLSLNNEEQVTDYFNKALENGYEGLILKSHEGKYKCGRGTIKEGLIYKYKPFITIDSKIIDVIQATKVDPSAEKTTNELGRSVTSKKKDDRILIEKASAFLVDYKGAELKVTIAMTDIEKEEIWRNKEKYIGKYVEYKSMQIGMKDLPRHPTSIRVRYDKN